MTKKSVLHILTRLIMGGADENTIFTIEGLIRDGYSVDLVVGGDSDPRLVEKYANLNIIVLPELRRNVKLSNLIAFWKIYRLIVTNGYYYVHTHTAMAGFLGRVAAKLAGTPVIIHSLHGITFHNLLHPVVRRIYILAERIAESCTDFFITVGEDVKQKYLAESIGTEDKYRVIRSGFDYEHFYGALNCRHDLRRRLTQELGLDQDDILFGTVSRIEPRKGHIYLIEAAQKVIAVIPKAKFIIVGEGYHREDLEEKVDRLGLQNNIFFIGHRDRIAEIMVCLDIFVLTSLWEGLPRVLVQAALLEKPIVTFEVEGAWEIVRNDVNGFVVPQKDIEVLSNKLIYLATDLPKARLMGNRSKTLIDGLWRKDVMIEKTRKVYLELAEGVEHR